MEDGKQKEKEEGPTFKACLQWPGFSSRTHLPNGFHQNIINIWHQEFNTVGLLGTFYIQAIAKRHKGYLQNLLPVTLTCIFQTASCSPDLTSCNLAPFLPTQRLTKKSLFNYQGGGSKAIPSLDSLSQSTGNGTIPISFIVLLTLFSSSYSLLVNNSLYLVSIVQATSVVSFSAQ